MTQTVTLPDGEEVPALGQGTWMMGERRTWVEDVRALKLGIELGMTLIDTAEMYGEGKAESLAGEAIQGAREPIFLVSKVQPHNASRKGVVRACERTLMRLRTDRLDLYLVHWRGNIGLEETVAGFEALRRDGKIRHWGVSNFDVADMEELMAIPGGKAADPTDGAQSAPGGKACAANQILYNLSRRSCEYELTPWLTQARIPVMAYSPFEQGRLHGNGVRGNGVLADVARAHNATPYQIALAWLLEKPGTMVIPKSGKEAHVRENFEAAQIALTQADRDALDRTFKPAKKRKSLDSL